MVSGQAGLISTHAHHSLVAWTIGITASDNERYRQYRYNFIWLGWLVIVALAPDLDYIVPFLHPSSNEGLRITHSLFFCQVLPVLSLIYLYCKGVSKTILWRSGLQLVLAGFSHIALDTLVGVTALPLIFPLSSEVFKLPFGLLPSAGKLSLFNYYLYSNLGIELGVLLPLSLCCYYLNNLQRMTLKGWFIISFLFLVSARFMYWAYSLSR